jgi:HD superfamily phosphohydrolase
MSGRRVAHPMVELKTITDTIHGTIRLEPLTLDLLETLELQRLNSIRQLGLTYLVFPGANHSRLEHCLGVGHVAGEMAKALNLPDSERKLVPAAGLLHDVGHGPFSHTLEHVLSRELAVDHMHLTQRIITGADDNVSPADRKAFPETLRIHEVLEKHDVDPRAVAALIRGPAEKGERWIVPRGRTELSRYLAQIIHSPMDADQIDYLMRDAHYTGASHGTIDFPRLLQTLRTYRGDLALDRKGLPALEGMLVARGLMYSSVYFHKTVRIAEQMIARAVERSEAPIGEIQKMVDHELLNWLVQQGPLQREIALRLKYRKLFKRVLASGRDELTDGNRAVLATFKEPRERRRVEDRIARRAGLQPGQVIVDVPLPELLLSEPRIAKTEVPILENGTAKPFSKVSPLGRALQTRQVVDWVVMVAAPGEAAASVRKAATAAFSD